MATRLSVNVNKLATLRNSRGKNNPDVLSWCEKIESVRVTSPNGDLVRVAGITVHPRPDERHIRFRDVEKMRAVVQGELNIEGYPDDRWLSLVKDVQPAQATLVPDPPHALTSDAGFDVSRQYGFLEKSIQTLKRDAPKVRVSVFIDPKLWSTDDARKLKELGADRIELYTESYAVQCEVEKYRAGQAPSARLLVAVMTYAQASEVAKREGLGVNAGHDLNQHNLRFFLDKVPSILEVSIGHALICDGLEIGLLAAVEKYLQISSGLNPASSPVIGVN